MTGLAPGGPGTAAARGLAAAGPGLADLLGHPFMRYALLAGSGVALAAGLVGYFVVLRGQLFTGDALSHVAFAGALAALVLGLDARLGLYASTVAVAVGMGLLGNRGRADDVVIGTVFAWILGLGVLFLAVYTSSDSAANGSAGVSVLFGSIFGLSSGQAVWAAAIGLGVVAAMLLIGRPLLFASLDEAVAAARGVPVRALGLAFLALVGVASGEATQAVGALLLVGLLAAPAGAANQLTDRPYLAMALSAGLALLSMGTGLVLAYAFPALPPSAAVLGVATAAFAAAYGWSAVRRWATGRSVRAAER